jgi:hypothetical protein
MKRLVYKKGKKISHGTTAGTRTRNNSLEGCSDTLSPPQYAKCVNFGFSYLKNRPILLSVDPDERSIRKMAWLSISLLLVLFSSSAVATDLSWKTQSMSVLKSQGLTVMINTYKRPDMLQSNFML